MIEISRDTTEHKRVEEALRASEKKYRSLVQEMVEGIAIADGSETFLFVNPAAERIFGVEPGALVGRNLRDFVDEQTFERIVSQTELRRQNQSSTYDLTIRRPDGVQRDLRVSASPRLDSQHNLIDSYGIIHDITERKRAEKALRESEERYRTTYENTGTAMVMLEEDTTILLANSEFAGLSGYSREEVKGKMKWTDFVAPEELERMTGYHYDRRREEGKAPTQYEFRFVARDGSIRDVLLNVNIIPGTSRSVASLLDITERKLAEEELEASRQQMRALSMRVLSAQEEERTRISREIHDELAQSLTALRYDISSLFKSLPEEKAVLQKKLASLNERVGETIRAVQRISTELRPGILDDLGLSAAVEWYLRDFQERTGITCDLRITPEDIILDTGRCTTVFRIFQEALTNAARHADATEVRVKLQEEPGKLLLEVRDDGRGITSEQASSTKSLGLTGMRERARLWDGSVTIKGTEGKGTVVLVRIPVDEPSAGGDAE